MELGESGLLADLRPMLDCRTQTRDISDHDEVEITDAAIGAYGRLLRAVGRAIRTHAAGDGGLICEDRINRTRPIMWRISPDGAVLPDSRYNFAAGAFIPAILPRGLTTSLAA